MRSAALSATLLGAAITVPAASAAVPYQISQTVGVGHVVAGVAVDPTTHTAYVVNNGDNTVSVVQGIAVTQTIPVGSSPKGVAVDPTTDTAYVANSEAGTVSVIHDGAVTQTIPVGNGPYGVAVDSSTHTVYVTNDFDNTVSVIQGGAVTQTIPVGSAPIAVAADPGTHAAYVANMNDNTVSVIQGGAVTQTIPVGTLPVSVAVDPVTHTAYVANADDGTLSEIDGGAVTQTVPVGNFPFGVGVGVVVNPSNDTAFVANDGNNTVAVVQNGSVIQTIPFPSSPQEVAVDSSTQSPTVYVTAADDTVSVLTAQQATTTTLASSVNPSLANQPVTLTATVSGPSGSTQVPGGTVMFQDGATTLGTAPVNGAGQATYTTSALSTGSHQITAVYGGDAGDQGSTSPALTQTVNPDTAAAVMALTGQYVQGSAAFKALPPYTQQGVKFLVNAAGQFLTQITPRLSPTQKAYLITGYNQLANALQRQGYLTATQAATLKSIAAGI